MAMKGGRSSESTQPGSLNSPNECTTDGIVYFSDAEDQSWRSLYHANCVASSFEIDRVPEPCRQSCGSSNCSDELELENGVPEIKIDLAVAEKECRICHLSLESAAPESGVAIELGCSCKDDLAAAHKQCAETWFKIKGNKTCEICCSTARNVAGSTETEQTEQLNEGNIPTPSGPSSENRRFWQGHRFLNFLLACMVFAFVISWLFHFNIPG